MRLADLVRMTRPLTLLLCITGAAAVACSKDKPAQSAYDTTEVTERPAYEEPLTPASSDALDQSNMHDPGLDSSPGTTSVAPDRSEAPDTIPPGDAVNDGGDSMRSGSSRATAPDNTARNERDRSSSATTPMDQGQSQSDLDITQKIRQAVMKDSSLSFTSKNVKIITRDGKVTLRGTVPTYEERLAIENAARNVAGQTHVTSELEVKK
jgi:hypothetical protein